MNSPMSAEAKRLLSKTIRDLRARLIADLQDALHRHYKLSIATTEATLDRAASTRRARLGAWIDEQLRARRNDDAVRVRDDVVKQAAYTLLNRLVYLRLLDVPVPPTFGPTADVAV